MNDQQIIRLCGITGIVAAALMLAADWLMLGTLTDASTFMRDWLTILAEMPRWRVTLGAIIGPLGAWLYVVGFWQLYVALRPAGRIWAFVCWAGFAIGFVYVAAAFHTSFPFYAYMTHATDALSDDTAAVETTLITPSSDYARLMFTASMPPTLVGCLVLAWAVWFRPTRYPRWTVVFNPLLLYVVTLSFRYVPAPLGGLLYIGYGNIVFLVFFVISTAVLWNRSEARGEDASVP